MGIRSYEKKEAEAVQYHHMNQLTCAVLEMYYRVLHVHRDVEVVIVLEGSLHITTSTEEFDMKAGDIAYFGPNHPHACQTTAIEGSRLLVIQFDPSFCVSYYPRMRNLFFDTSDLSSVLSEETLSDLRSVCLRIGIHYFEQTPGFEFQCMGDVNRIMEQMVGGVPYQLIAEEAYLSVANYEKRMERIITYVQDNYAKKITLQELADREGLSTSYVSHLFKDHLHKSFQSFLNELRLERAIFLLKNTNMKVIEICIESGFSDSKYLSQAFINLFGMTPREFRNQYQNLEKSDLAKDSKNGEFVYDETQSLELLRNT